MPILKKVRVNWTKIQEPNRSVEYGDSWETEVEVDAAATAQLTADGLAGKIKDNGKGTQVLRLKRKLKGNKKAGGTFDKTQPKCVDSVKRPFEGLIGNGSVCNVAYNITKSNFGISADFAGIQVLELVTYEPVSADASDEFADESGSITTASEAIFSDDIPF